jgi:hypothetical protein
MRLKQLSVAILCIGMMTVACQKENKLSEMKQSAKIEKEGGKNPIEAFFIKNRLKSVQKFNLNRSKRYGCYRTGWCVTNARWNDL